MRNAGIAGLCVSLGVFLLSEVVKYAWDYGPRQQEREMQQQMLEAALRQCKDLDAQAAEPLQQWLRDTEAVRNSLRESLVRHEGERGDGQKDIPRPAHDWPIFRGNALQTGVAVEALPDQLEVLWKFTAKDSIEGTAAIVSGVVYVGSLDENLYALDLATGQEKWRYKAGPIKAPVSLRGGLVYVGNLDGMFHCVDAATGKKRWTFETEGEISSGANFAGENVLFGSGDEHVYCLSAEGKLVWKFKVPGGPVLGSPAVVGDRTFAAGCDSTLHVIDVAKGKEVASLELGSQIGATPAVIGDRLYVGTMSTNNVLAIDWKKPEVLWTFQAAQRQMPFYASVAATDNLVIAGSRDKRVWAIDRKTGKEVWSFATERHVDSSPVVVGNRVFAGSLDGKLYVLDLGKGTELKKFDLGSAILGSPAVGGGCLVIGTEKGVVYCLGAKKQ